ncbi:hypothetical protein KY284_004032 [Solanum tuberosum]|nr:hypothetical protein KY284_004032 [Solanum tuberosum]
MPFRDNPTVTTAAPVCTLPQPTVKQRAAQEGQLTTHLEQYYTPGVAFEGPNSVQFGSLIDIERPTQGLEQKEMGAGGKEELLMAYFAAMVRPFHTTIKIGEMVESGLKTRKIVSQAEIKATTQAIQVGSSSYGNRKRKEEASSLASGSRGAQRNSNCPYPPIQGQSSYPQHYYPYHGGKRKFTPLRESYSSLFQKLKKIEVIESIPPHYLNPNAPGFQANERCEYHSEGPGHSTDNYWTLKRAIEKLINHGVVVVTDDQNTPNEDRRGKSLKSSEPVACLSVEGINLDTKVLCVPGVSKRLKVRSVQQLPVTNPKVVPWNYNKIVVFYQGKKIVEEVDETRGLTCLGRCYSLEELRKGKMAPRYPSTTEEGRSWIHMAQAVPSTLHQVVKFEYDHQEIIVHREDDLSIYRDSSILNIEALEGCDCIVYQSFEVVSVDQFKERNLIVQPCLYSSSSMVATTMIKYGYQPTGKGLGLCSQGIVDPIAILGNQGTSGLGYKQSKWR